MVMVTTQWWAAPAQAANGDDTATTATDLSNFTNTSSGQRTGQTLQHSATDAYNYYKFALDSEKEIRILIDNQETSEALLTITDGGGNVIFTADRWDSTGSGTNRKYEAELSWELVGPGTWYIRIHQADSTNNTFDLKWWVRDGLNFPNDDCAAGIWTTCEVGGFYTNTDGKIANISLNSKREKDFDWFEFNLPVDNIYYISVTPTGSNKQPIIMVYDEYGQFIGYSFIGKIR